MAVLTRGASKDVVFWDLVHLPGGTSQDICEVVFAFYERDGVDARRLCSSTSDGASVMAFRKKSDIRFLKYIAKLITSTLLIKIPGKRTNSTRKWKKSFALPMSFLTNLVSEEKIFCL